MRTINETRKEFLNTKAKIGSSAKATKVIIANLIRGVIRLAAGRNQHAEGNRQVPRDNDA